MNYKIITKKKLISSFTVALFSTIFVGGIFYLTDTRFRATDGDKMFSWGFVIIYFSAMLISHLFMDRLMIFFKKTDRKDLIK
ncbi:hypothetical protein [Chryseobacterium taichungense]|uniref:hypothetical protein n=1 Tax=Chryseobacterium taichungense TaxID=295069 RepID=UPI0028B05059|nr:hypothetical protein [Chryseobacterium taichungense]